MTEQETLRELDAWIAENVMGWILDSPKSYRKGVAVFAFWNEGSTSRLAQDWKPTTDRAASQEVLERCNATTDVHFALFVEGQPFEIWGGGHRAKAETLPLTVALFAKKLFGKG
jgi:hypothetical protein